MKLQKFTYLLYLNSDYRHSAAEVMAVAEGRQLDLFKASFFFLFSLLQFLRESSFIILGGNLSAGPRRVFSTHPFILSI